MPDQGAVVKGETTMGMIRNFATAVGAVAKLAIDNRAALEQEYAHDVQMLDAEIDELRAELAKQREVIERQRLDVAEVLARHEARKGESLAVFVARTGDDMAKLRADLATAQHDLRAACSREGHAERRAEDASAKLAAQRGIVQETWDALRDLVPIRSGSLPDLAKDVADEVRRLRSGWHITHREPGRSLTVACGLLTENGAAALRDGVYALACSASTQAAPDAQQEGAAEEWDAAAAAEQGAHGGHAIAPERDESLRVGLRTVHEVNAYLGRDTLPDAYEGTAEESDAAGEEVCRTCAAKTAGDGVRLPGAVGLCAQLYSDTGSAVHASLYQIARKPKACPGWRAR